MMMQSLGSETWQGTRVELATAAPAAFELFQGDQVRKVTPGPDDSMHMIAVLSDAETRERIPYAGCWITVTGADGKVVFDERMWPMISRDMGTELRDQPAAAWAQRVQRRPSSRPPAGRPASEVCPGVEEGHHVHVPAAVR